MLSARLVRLTFIALWVAAPAFAQSGAPMNLAPPSAPASKAISKQAPGQAPKTTIDAASAVTKANAFFNANLTMVADFVQLSADGRRTGGTLYVQRPGKLRFEYARPATLEIIADGTSVAIRDRKLATQDVYFIGQTPLKFLLKERIDIARDTKVLDVRSDEKSVAILVEDKATFGGTSRIRLVFDTATFNLKQWTVTDPQGYETLVSLSNVDLGQKPDQALFRINYEKFN
ncbi:MAG: outer rane lipoprotein carrier protein LolA [Hyphomicrobiales bacterium]|jgi:outer membrane lipoprotein-sorting protein|nr:outer rane lipoprotein carrier protein LolA [Hyphomicrobiales bacterium]